MNHAADTQLECWARYGCALGHAAANVVHEVNAPLGVALARAQLVLRLLSDLPSEQVAALDEQLRGCEAAIRSSATVVRDLNFLRGDIDSIGESASLTHVLSAAYQLTLLDATHAGCEMKLYLPIETVSVCCNSYNLLVLLLELVWDRVKQGAKAIRLQLDKHSDSGDDLATIVVASDLMAPCDDDQQSWIDLLVATVDARIHWHSVGQNCHAYVIEWNLHEKYTPV